MQPACKASLKAVCPKRARRITKQNVAFWNCQQGKQGSIIIINKLFQFNISKPTLDVTEALSFQTDEMLNNVLIY